MKTFDKYLNKVYAEDYQNSRLPKDLTIEKSYEDLFAYPTIPERNSELKLTPDMRLNWNEFAKKFADRNGIDADQGDSGINLFFPIKRAQEIIEKLAQEYTEKNLTAKYRSDFWILNGKVKRFDIQD